MNSPVHELGEGHDLEPGTRAQEKILKHDTTQGVLEGLCVKTLCCHILLPKIAYCQEHYVNSLLPSLHSNKYSQILASIFV